MGLVQHEPGHILRQIDLRRAHSLRGQQLGNRRQWRTPQAQAPALGLGQVSALLDRVPHAVRSGHGIGGQQTWGALNAEELLQVRRLTAEGQARPHRLDHLRVVRDLGMAPDEGSQGLVCLKIFGEELAISRPKR